MRDSRARPPHGCLERMMEDYVIPLMHEAAGRPELIHEHPAFSCKMLRKSRGFLGWSCAWCDDRRHDFGSLRISRNGGNAEQRGFTLLETEQLAERILLRQDLPERESRHAL